MEPLKEQQIRQILKDRLNDWVHKDDKLHREFSFADFKEALGFIVRVGFIAEDLMHHPELFNVYNSVKISLTTHDAGGKVTEKDIQFAEAAEDVYTKYST